MLQLIFVSTVVLAGYVLLVLVSPHQKCVKCKGKRVIRKQSWWNGKGRMVRCPRCRGNGRHQRPLARHIHRLRWTLRDYRASQKDEDQS